MSALSSISSEDEKKNEEKKEEAKEATEPVFQIILKNQQGEKSPDELKLPDINQSRNI